MTYTRNLASAVALVGAFAATAAQAQPANSGLSHNSDYQWTAVGPVGWSGIPGVKNSPSTLSAIKTRIVHTGTNSPVEADAVLFATADMAPDGMPNMTTRVRRLPEVDSTIYRVALDPIMAGHWALHLQAQPSGVSEPVQATLIVTLTGPIAGTEPAKTDETHFRSTRPGGR